MNGVSLAVAIVATALLLCLGSLAQADITIDTVAVCDRGNVADNPAHSGNPAGQGSVSYNYSIGKFEVTAGQYTAFLNAVAATDPYGLYSTSMTGTYGCNVQRTGSSGSYSYSVASDWENRPVNCVSYWDACRFANWLGNGQGSGDTENGAYTLTASGMASNTITRNASATWAVASEDEWYKAAYYQGGSTNGYWWYPTRSNEDPASQVLSIDPGNSANYWNGTGSIGDPYYRTNVGEFENSASAYGTFDQGGNVWEWNEAVIEGGSPGEAWSSRGLRGGGFSFNDRAYMLRSSTRSYNQYGYDWFGYDYRDPMIEGPNVGFRVVQIPEPSSLLAIFCGLGALGGRLLRKKRS